MDGEDWRVRKGVMLVVGVFVVVLVGAFLYLQSADTPEECMKECLVGRMQTPAECGVECNAVNLCGDGVCGEKELVDSDLCPEDCEGGFENDIIDFPLYFTINVHIEPGKGQYCNNETFYNNGKIILENLMDISESVGAKLSVFTEYPFLYGALKYEKSGDNIITELIDRGHSVGFHSHYGGGLFNLGNSNLCESNNYPEVNENNYVDHFEFIFKEVLDEENIYEYTKVAYGAFGNSLIELKRRGVTASYGEYCGYPQAGENANYVTKVESKNNLLIIPLSLPKVYLSTIYYRSPELEDTCFEPENARDAVCGKWYQSDFETVYSAIEAAVELPKEVGSINTAGITFHVHNFDDESKGTCGRDEIYPNYDELDMFENWLITKIKPLKDNGEIIFSNANEIIEFKRDSL